MKSQIARIDFLGTGWDFPPAFPRNGQTVAMTAGEEDIRKSLEVLLSTNVGERLMQPNYGCNMEKLLFEPMDASLKTYIKDIVETAILYHEPRIEVNAIELDMSRQLEGVILVHIDYTVRTTNSRFNFVYPFYLNEANTLAE
jgi:phage baseplate assembly protein W